MKKSLRIFLMVLVGISFLTASFADEARTITQKTTVVTSNSVVSASGVTVYKVTGYANAANALYALVDARTLGAASASAYKVEGGEASQYDSLPTLDFGDEGIRFNTGLTVFTVGAYVNIEYD